MNIDFRSCKEETIILSRFFPDALPLHLDARQLDHTATLLTLHVTSTQRAVPCPVCAVFTHRIHSGCTRLLADLPWGAACVRWQLHVRKFFCANPQCPRRIFTERLPGVVAPWARRPQRLTAWLSAIGLALGRAAGARLGRRLGLMVSRYTLLRVVRRLPLPCDRTPQVLGIDDFAFRKRQTYGTVLIDLGGRRPVALLPDREAETVALWLQAHPGVEAMARDRSKAYERGVRQGAPTITQVADRFHLVQNLAETLEQVLSRHSAALKAVNGAMRAAYLAPHNSPGVALVPLAPRPPLAQAIAIRRRAQRSATYEGLLPRVCAI